MILRRWWIYPLPDGTLQAAPDSPAWGGGGILVQEVPAFEGDREQMIEVVAQALRPLLRADFSVEYLAENVVDALSAAKEGER